jgi:large subunit ribosomal protein L22
MGINMESRAIQRYIDSSPRKMRLVVDMIRGLSVDDAISYLHFSSKHASKIVEKVIRSAVSNLMNQDETKKVETSHLFVKTVFVDEGPMVKRVLPAPMGRAYRVRKRSNHVTVIVAEKNHKVNK